MCAENEEYIKIIKYEHEYLSATCETVTAINCIIGEREKSGTKNKVAEEEMILSLKYLFCSAKDKTETILHKLSRLRLL